MSPPKVQVKSTLVRNTSDVIPGTSRHLGAMYPYDATPGLIHAFEELKSQDRRPLSSPQASAVAPRLPPIIHNRAPVQRRRTDTDLPSSVPLPAPTTAQEGSLANPEALVGRSSNISVAKHSAATSSDMIERVRPNTAPLRMHGTRQPSSPIKNAATAIESPFKAYGQISDSVSRTSPYGKPIPQPPSSPELEVYGRHESNGRLMVCEAREQHCSNTVTDFVGERTGIRDITELKGGLLRILGHLGNDRGERAKADLKVATGNMLEGIVAWDLNRAEALEQLDVPLLSTVPTVASLNKVDAIYIIKMFRLGMQKIPSEDVRSKIGRLPDHDLMALLHFTLLISRPVLVWELNLDEI